VNGGSSEYSRYRLGISCLGSFVASGVYRSTGVDMTYPTHVYAMVNNECNSRCVMCDMWRYDDKAEIPAHFWIDALRGLRSSLRAVKVSFSGGEVFLKTDIFEILRGCADAGIPFGVVTNGILLTPENVERYLECRPMNLSVSIDSLDPVIYGEIRGTSSLQRVRANMESLMDRLEHVGSNLRVTLKTVVNRKNLPELGALAAYAQQMGLAGITFDPIKRTREPFTTSFVREFEDIFAMESDSLREAADELIGLKRSGYPILNSEANMREWIHYADSRANDVCTVPLNSLYVDRLGDVRICDFRGDSIGNIQESDLRLMWRQPQTQSVRKELVGCDQPCVYCVRRGMKDYLSVFLAYGKRRPRRPRAVDGQ
jgi:MoaA/NifB/PqqE/SkfB family radical SAM enzyme